MIVEIAALAVGGVAVAVVMYRVGHHKAELSLRQGEIAELRNSLAVVETRYETEKQAWTDKVVLLTQAREELERAFKALSADVLQSNNQTFLQLATETLQRFQVGAHGELEKRETAISELVKPMRESLERFDQKVQDLERARHGAYEGLNEQLRALRETNEVLRTEASNLVRALGTPRVRGRWGEIQLRRVVEIAGMLDHCDFFEQQSVTGEEGRLRPDLVIRLPGGKSVVVDAKAPLAAYLEAIECTDEPSRVAKISEHARQIRAHVVSLSRKAYWEQFPQAPEFVILFLPGESFFSAALERDPALIEEGVASRVLLATPTTLITLLKTVAYGWQQEQMAKSAEAACALGKELYQRIRQMGEYFADVGVKLSRTVESYNKTVGSLENRVMVSARRFDAMQVGGEPIEQLQPIDMVPREIQTPELRAVANK